MPRDAQLVDFYYGLGSRYSYLASTQIDRPEAETGQKLAEFRRLRADPATVAAHLDTVREAHRRGAFGVPTFFAGQEMF